MDTRQAKPWKDDFKRWVPSFVHQVKADGTARKAWSSVQRHCMMRANPVSSGLVGQAALLLFLSTPKFIGRFLPLDEMHRRVQQADDLFKRALGVEARASLPPQRPGRGRPRLSPERAVLDAVNSPWLVNDGNIGTMQDAFVRLKEDIGRDFSISEGRKLIVQTAGPKQSKFNNYFPLGLLQELAAEYGLNLGHLRIDALARCAGSKVSERTLGRYLASLGESDRRNIRENSLSSLRQSAISRQEFPALFALL